MEEPLSLDKPEELESLAALYHENTKLRSYHYRDELRLFLDLKKLRQVAKPFKTYPYARQKISLPKEWSQPLASIEAVIQQRRTIRKFSGAPLQLSELARLLFYSAGVTQEVKYANTDITMYLRAAPSGGALFPIEIYPVVLRVQGLEPGIYHYNAYEHILEGVCVGEDYAAPLKHHTFKQEANEGASVFFIFTALPERTLFKYANRGYRYILIEAGHIAQNLYLMGTAMGLGICTIGGFIDDAINDMLMIDGVYEYALYIAIAGKIQE